MREKASQLVYAPLGKTLPFMKTCNVPKVPDDRDPYPTGLPSLASSLNSGHWP